MFSSKVVLALLSALAVCSFLGCPSEAKKQRVFRTLACEGHKLKLSCPTGQIVQVLEAGYGRRNSTICNFFDEDEPDFQECQSQFAFDIIRALCSGHKHCSVTANNRLFQDPCPGQVKYAEAKYTCISGEDYIYPPPV